MSFDIRLLFIASTHLAMLRPAFGLVRQLSGRGVVTSPLNKPYATGDRPRQAGCREDTHGRIGVVYPIPGKGIGRVAGLSHQRNHEPARDRAGLPDYQQLGATGGLYAGTVRLPEERPPHQTL